MKVKVGGVVKELQAWAELLGAVNRAFRAAEKTRDSGLYLFAEEMLLLLCRLADTEVEVRE